MFAVFFCSPLTDAQASLIKPPPDTNPYIIVEGPPWFVQSIGDAAGILAFLPQTEYLFRWMTTNEVHIKWWEDAPGDYIWGYTVTDKTIWVGQFTATDATIDATMIAMTGTYIRDNLLLGQCDPSWLNFRAWWAGYSISTLIHVPTYYQNYMFEEAFGWGERIWKEAATCPNWQKL